MSKIIWLTGNSESGKTTLAKALKERLSNCIILDGDEMRASISLNAGFSKEAREEHNLRVARLAKVLQAQNYTIVIAVIAPFQSTRDKINKIIDCEWVYLKRDSNKKGKDYPYEIPINTFTLDIDKMLVKEEVRAVIETFKL